MMNARNDLILLYPVVLLPFSHTDVKRAQGPLSAVLKGEILLLEGLFTTESAENL